MLLLNFFPVASPRLLLSNYPMKKWLASVCFLSALVTAASTLDAAPSMQYLSPAAPELPAAPAALVIALEYENGNIRPQGETASLRLPAASEENREDRRCMTVCSSWGEECVITPAGADVVTEKCVRTCQSFAEECL